MKALGDKQNQFSRVSKWQRFLEGDSTGCPGVTRRVVFNLKDSYYQLIKEGKKTSECRDAKPYWIERLFQAPVLDNWRERKDKLIGDYGDKVDLGSDLKTDRVWLVLAYSKHSLPRLEARIVTCYYYPKTEQLEVVFDNLREVTA